MKIFKKLLIGICIMSMLITPISVFGSDRYNSKAFYYPSQSKVSITDRPILGNGQGALFVNSYTDTPFLFLQNSSVIINIEFEDITYCEVNLMRSSNTISSKSVSGEKSSKIEFDIPVTSKDYRIFIVNYGLDPLKIKDFTVDSTADRSYYLESGNSLKKVLCVGDDVNPSSAIVILTNTFGNIMFQILDSNGKTVASRQVFGRNCPITFNPLPKGNYIFNVINGNVPGDNPGGDSFTIYDMYFYK